MAEKTVRVCDLCLTAPGGIAVSSGAISWRGSRGNIDVCQAHQSVLEDITGAPKSPVQASAGPGVATAVSAETATPAPAPKKRGRPPKAKPESTTAAAAPKKRGRPPKAKAETAPAAVAPKKRGRPPKAKAETTPASAEKPKATQRVTAKKKPSTTFLTPSSTTIRAWAKSNKVPVSERGAIGASTLAAYYEAHPEITSQMEVKSDKPKKGGRRVAPKSRPEKKSEPAVETTGKVADDGVKEPQPKQEVAIPLAEFSGSGV